MKSVARSQKYGFVFLIIALVIGASPVAAGQSQEFDPNFYTSSMTGFDIDVTGPEYAISNVELQHYPSGEGEIIQIGADTLVATLEVSFFDDIDTPQDTLEIYLRSLETVADEYELVDRGIRGDYHYAMASVQYDGVEIVYFIQVYEDLDGNTDLLEAIITGASMLENDLRIAQNEITINGVAFMDNVDPSDVQDVFSTGGTLSSPEVATPVGSVEPVDSVDFTQTDTSVSIGPDFVFSGMPESKQSIETVTIQGPETNSVIAIGQTGDAPGAVLDSFQQGIVSVYPEADRVYEEILGDHGWRILWIPQDDGSDTYMIIVVNNAFMPGMELLHAHELPADGVASKIITIQDQITINGQPLMPEIDAEEMDLYVNRHASDTTTAEPTDEVEELEPVVDPRDGARLPEDTGVERGENDEVENTSETRGTTEATAEATIPPTEEATSEASDGPGILTDSSWEGGVFGHLIEWDANTWSVDADFPEDLVSDPVNEEDTIVLQSSSVNGSSWFFISVYGNNDLIASDFLDYWSSDEFLAEMDRGDMGAEILDARTRGDGAGVIIQYADEDGNQYVAFRQAVQLENGNLLIITLDVPAEDAVEMYALAADVTFDGESTLQVFSNSQIQRIFGD